MTATQPDLFGWLSAAARRGPRVLERLPAVPTMVFVVGLAANGAALVWASRGVYFWADEFDLLFRRGIIPADDVGLFQPHSAHWMTLPMLVYRLLFMLFGLASYLPWALTQIALHLAVCACLYALLRRFGAHPWASVGGGLVAAWFGAGANGQVWAAGMNHTGALLLGLVAALVVARPTATRGPVIVGAVLMTAAAAFSLTSISAGVVVAVVVAFQRGGRAALATVTPGLVALTWWFVLVGRTGLDEIDGTPTPQRVDPSRLPATMWNGMVDTFSNGLGLAGLGPLVLLAVVGCLLFTRVRAPALLVFAGAGVAGDTVQLLMTAYGRYSSTESLGSAVYGYVNIVLLAPAVAFGAHALLVGRPDAARRGPRWIPAVSGAALLLVYVGHGLVELRTWHSDITLVSGGNLGLMEGMLAADDFGERPLDVNYPESLSQYFLPTYVLAPQIRAALPAQAATPEDRMAAESSFFVGVGSDSYGFDGPAALRVVSGFEGPPIVPQGCRSYLGLDAARVLDADTGDGIEMEVESPSTTVFTLLTREGISGPVRRWQVEPGVVHIATSAKDAVLTVSFGSAGRYRICADQ